MNNISTILIESLLKDNANYISWLKNIKLSINEEDCFASNFTFSEYPVWPRYNDNFHYPLGMRKILELGFSGIRNMALQNAQKFSGNQKKYLILIADVYNEIIKIIFAFAEIAENAKRTDISNVCRNIALNPPKTFIEACQTYWISQIIRVGTSTIGRIDQHLYPFFKNDLENILIDHSYGKKIMAKLLDLFEKRGSGKGDTLQNITLSGVDEDFHDMTNDLTYIILEYCLEKKNLEPKINVRFNKNSPAKLHRLVSELQMQGSGICTVFNDDVIVNGLMKYDRPSNIACDYCADGCTEIILDGIGATWFRYIDCVKAVEHTIFNGEENVPEEKKMQYYSSDQESIDIKAPVEKGLRTGDFLKMETFDDFYDAYIKQLRYQVERILIEPYNSDDYPMRAFTAASMPNVLENAKEPYTNSDCYHTYGLFIGSLGTAVNSISSVKSLIYDKSLISKSQLIDAIKNNFIGYESIKQLCVNAPKFGNDDDFVDKLAVRIAEQFASMVIAYKDRNAKPILPGLYNHLFHHTAYRVGATPDGRKYGDPVGEHLSPTPGTAFNGPTATINSVCKINTSEQIFGSTLHLNIPRVAISNTENPLLIIESLNKGFLNQNGCVLNVNVLDAASLIDAQINPDKYADLIVRVWGFSYYFVKLSKEMQDHVISRAKQE